GGPTNINNPIPDLPVHLLTPLTYSYYDHYDYAGNQSYETKDVAKLTAGSNPYAEDLPSSPSVMTTGLPTGSKVRVLGTDQWLVSSIYYDDKGRVIQTIGDNHTGGKDVLTSRYDFSGKVLSTYLSHTVPRSTTLPQTTVLTTMEYDQMDRLLRVKKQLNDRPELVKTIAENSYDELGQLKRKRLGVTGTTTQLDTLNYDYNIRGWLSGINKAFVNSNEASGTTNWFGQELSYDGGFVNNQYNGNIAGIKWKSRSDEIARAYGYDYDRVNRLTVADFSQQNSAGWNRDSKDFSVGNLNYDENGNIMTMMQKGMIGASSAVIDQLTYSYIDNSNRLKSVGDVANTTSAQLGDFINGTNSDDDYAYDINGNLIKDQNKQIAAIVYNHLNLPQSISIDGKGTIAYQYDAAGNKLSKTVTDITKSPALTTVTDYLGGLVYKNDTLQLLSHEEGRIRTVFSTGQPVVFAWDYFEKDHLGNVRMVLTEQSDFSMYAATMETTNAAKENALFSNIDNSRVPKPVGYPADDNDNRSVAKLTADEGGSKIGPSIVLRVMAGDTVSIGAKAFYKSNGSSVSSPDGINKAMLTALVQAFNGAASGTQHGISSDQSETFNTNFYNDEYQQLKAKAPNAGQPDRPKAYLNFVLFDDQFKLVEENSGVKQVQATPDQLQLLSQEKMVMMKSGFLYVYTSNESKREVYFDDVVLGVHSGPMLEETHYYPFGLTMAGISSNALKGANYSKNRKEFNGIEHTTDLDLNQYDAFYRNLDPQIGRWYQIDPKVTEYQSPYAIMNNNPVRYADFLGDTINDRQIRTDKTWGKAYQTWSQSKAGKEFIKLFGAGGKLGHINITFKVEDTNGRSGNTTVFKVNKKDGTETKLETNQVYKGVGSIASGTSKTDYLKFMIKFDANETDIGLENAETILHETQHVRIDQQTLVSNEAMAPASMQHADWMKPASTQWYKERYNFYQENRAVWNPDYERQKAAGKVKSEQDYINRKINDFIN
ncbi:RHS repeat-associated core domain-containing protein, partial [Chitinophaga sp. 30R24]|uniref:RHS repeat protein n=1 Tax=Chitinophaga sp. 30R24 TaxID=3248838 RepID=UPI003B8F3A59